MKVGVEAAGWIGPDVLPKLNVGVELETDAEAGVESKLKVGADVAVEDEPKLNDGAEPNDVCEADCAD